VRNRTLTTDLLIWICKERKGLAESVFDIDLANAILDALEYDHVQGGPKRTGRLSDFLSDDKTLIHELVIDTEEDEVKRFAKRILATAAFDELTRRSLMARIIKARPEMEALMAENAGPREDNSLIVSWESLERKKQELEELVSVKIPQNKHDIQIARAEGDLRENGGYKAAKEQQAVLLRLQSKMERELRLARGTDFANTPAEKVGIGTVVEYETPGSGETETLIILGAWDGDVGNNIVSYLSEIARSLIGKAPGESAGIPSESGALKTVQVLAIRPYNNAAAAD
jgi:transcription elongation GreA/GreB family factor